MSYNQQAEVERRRGKAWLPLVGFILIVCFGVIAYYLGDPVRDFVDRRAGADLSTPEMLWLVRGVLFLSLVMIGGLLFALFAPRKREDVKDKDIYKDKKAIDAEVLARKERRKKAKRDLKNM
jgi:hypothetical protein